MSRNIFRQFDNFLGGKEMLGYQPSRYMKHTGNLIANIVKLR